MKERYRNLFDKIAPERSNDELLSAVLRKAERKNMTKKFAFKRAVIIPIAAVFGLCATAVTAGAIYNGIQDLQRSEIAKNQDVAEKIQNFIFEDSNGRVKMTVEEYISDGLAAFMTVHYEALNDEGKAWLNSFSEIVHEDLYMRPKFEDDKHATSHSYGNTELTEYRTESDRYFRLETEVGTRTYGGRQVTLNYILGAEQKSIDLDTECSVEVYRYELKTDEQPTDLFTPKYLEISDLSFSILGMNHKVYVHEVRENGNSWHSLLPVDMDLADFLGTTLIMKDGSRVFLGHGNCAMGSQYPLEENYFTDLAVCSGTYNLFDEETQKWSYKSIEAENVEAIELCGAVYELIPME